MQGQPDFQRLLESASGPFLVLATDLTIVAVSEAYLTATKTRHEEVLGRRIFDVFPRNPDDPTATGTSNLRTKRDRPDATDREPAPELFRIAVEASPSALLIVDRNGVVVFANAHAEQMLLYSREDLVGTNVDMLTPVSVRPHHAGLRESYFAAPSRRKLGSGRELAGVRKDGTEIPLEIALAPVQLANGAGVLVSLVDISERKNLQAKLSQSERLAAVGELAAGVAHEINNPVNTMINCAQLVVDGDDAASNCRIIMEEGARIAAIVKDLLQFARDDRGRPQATSIAEVVARTLRLMGESIKRHGIRLEVDVAGELPPVLANPDQLQQVLLNLVINAKDALQHAPSPEHRCITITARRHAENAVRCSVRDNGPGIASELGARIFEPFVTTKRARGGTGLGLSVSRSIVESFGGTLTYESVPGKGAEFWCVLPLATTQEDLPEGDFVES